MGSSGTGNFSDYPGSSGGRPSGKGGGGSGGGAKQDKCEAAIEDLALEDVALSEYFAKHKTTPSEGTKIRLREKLVGGRVAVETRSVGQVIGYVPTAYNYLRKCMSDGWTYDGKVSSSSSGKLPKVKVDLSGSK